MFRTASGLTTFVAAFLTLGASAANLTLAHNHTGANFFDGWNFYNGLDVNTTGKVFYQSQLFATSNGLAFINEAGNAVFKVDNVTDGSGNSSFLRNSIRLESSEQMFPGNLLLMDAVHMPFGCSVWPAFWTVGPDWPLDGEIDIVENVNLAVNNAYAIHTSDGCTHPPANESSSIETGNLIGTDCFNATNHDEGCLLHDPSTNSYGPGFATNGGGVFATLWDDDGIKIWFFERPNIPADVPTANPDPTGWGLPVASYPSASCDTTKYFSPQTVVFDITLCGNFAGSPSIFNPSCPGLCTDYVGDPSHYNDAYFEVSYVRLFVNGTINNSGSNSSDTSGPVTSSSLTSSSPPSTVSTSTPSPATGRGSRSLTVPSPARFILYPVLIGLLTVALLTML